MPPIAWPWSSPWAGLGDNLFGRLFGGGGPAVTTPSATLHSGSVIGLDPVLFADAPRFHGGGH